MATQENVTPRQLELARKALWHQNGDALRTMESVRGWLESAGLIPLYPHPQFQAPAPSFAEAVLGRPEQGWIPQPKRSASAGTQTAPDGSNDDSMLTAVEDEEPEEDDLNGTEEDFDSEADEDDESDDADKELEISDEDEFEDEEDDEDIAEEEDESEDENEPDSAEGNETSEGDEAALAGDGNIPSDRETMLSDDDEFAEDEGDEIAERDRIDAEGNPLPNNLRVTSDPTPASESIPSEPAPTPINGFTPEERETVHRTLARLVDDGTVVPLNLLGSTTGDPDFLVTASAFSFVYTLRGDKNWKNEPATTGSMRVSPLAVKAYSTLKDKGALPLDEITTELGQGITDSATLRALNELWAIQRVLPLPDPEGKPAKWEIMSERYLRHMKAGANAGQPTALSALLSLYLAQTVAATTDEMEIFLSPLAARSRVRDVVHGLSASRQLEPLVVEGKTLLHVAGALPELPIDDTAFSPKFAQRSRYEADDRRAEMEQRRATEGNRPATSTDRPARTGKYPVRRPAGARDGDTRGPRSSAPRPFTPGSDRPSFERRDRPAGTGNDRPAFGRGDRHAFGQGGRPAFSRGDRPSFSRGDRPAAGPRPSFKGTGGADDRERRPFQRRDPEGSTPTPQQGDRPERSSFARPWDDERAARPARLEGQEGERRPCAPREGGERRPFNPRESGERKPFNPREGGERRPFTPRSDGERRTFTPREGGERRPFTPRSNGERRTFTPREGGERRPFTPRSDGERRPFTPREGGDRRTFTPRGDGERKAFVPRDSGERGPFVPRGDGERRPFTPRVGSQERPSRNRFSGEPGEGRPSFQAGAHSAGPGGAKFGGSGFSRDRGGKGAPGKFGRPGGRPSFKGPGSGPARGGAPKRRPE